MLNRTRLHPPRPRHGRPLHKKERPIGPLRIPLHHHRPVPQMRQQPSAHPRVIRNQFPLGNLLVLPKHLPQIRQLHRLSSHPHLDISLPRNIHRHFALVGQTFLSASSPVGRTFLSAIRRGTPRRMKRARSQSTHRHTITPHVTHSIHGKNPTPTLPPLSQQTPF